MLTVGGGFVTITEKGTSRSSSNTAGLAEAAHTAPPPATPMPARRVVGWASSAAGLFASSANQWRGMVCSNCTSCFDCQGDAPSLSRAARSNQVFLRGTIGALRSRVSRLRHLRAIAITVAPLFLAATGCAVPQPADLLESSEPTGDRGDPVSSGTVEDLFDPVTL